MNAVRYEPAKSRNSDWRKEMKKRLIKKVSDGITYKNDPLSGREIAASLRGHFQLLVAGTNSAGGVLKGGRKTLSESHVTSLSTSTSGLVFIAQKDVSLATG